MREPSFSARTALLAVVCLLLPGAGVWLGAAGSTWHVDDATCPAPGAGTQANPFCRIQDAICAASSGDLVNVAPGTYPESLRMRPGVSVISQSGAPVTTINGAGKPCTASDYCTKLAGSQCSVVIFSVGHTPSTRLEGFTITGGQGVIQSSPSHVAGGGIFVFSSPTIANNVITNNVISGPRSQFNGGGIYVAVGSPVITGNTIVGNRVVPGPGSPTLTTYGYGGGIWSGFFSSPVITSNVISGNRAGDPNVAYSIGGGGGVIVFPGDSGSSSPIVDRNLITDNEADTLGGGVGLIGLDMTAAAAVVTNNVIVGNRAARDGGGVYVYLCSASVVNNTISDNFGFLGGGLYVGQNDAGRSVSISNNVIEGNRLDTFGNGGGIYTLDLNPSFDPEIEFNDLFGNQRNAVAGESDDSGVLGVNGNFAADPGFTNKAARDFRPVQGSPLIDRGSSSSAPPVDKNNQARGVDGDGAPNSPAHGDVDIGAFEFAGACVPAAEACDGADNNCNLQIDEGFSDQDGDSLADCVDPDDDNDLVADLSDCAPLDPTSFGPPLEVGDLAAQAASPTQISFAAQSIGSSTRYEIVSGLLSRLRAIAGFQEDFCLAAQLPAPAYSDTRNPTPAGDGWFYLARAANGCGAGTLGSPAADAPGAGDVCAQGIVDADADGSPSDLDCDDSDAARSPIQAEVCDGVDNDCSGTPDDNVPDTDDDGQDDCVDADDDGDLVGDAGDCAPLDPTAFASPVEVGGLEVAPGSPTGISWTGQVLGSGTRYDVASGLLIQPGAVSFPAASCVGSVVSPQGEDPRPDPQPGELFFYLVRARNACGAGTYGTPQRDAIPACP